VKAHVNVQDVEGRIAVNVVFCDDRDNIVGFDKDSNAHQVALIVLKYIDTELLTPLVEPEIVTNETAPEPLPAMRLVEPCTSGPDAANLSGLY
jgi:hypothetical protein